MSTATGTAESSGGTTLPSETGPTGEPTGSTSAAQTGDESGSSTTAPIDVCRGRARTVFVNFDGVTLTPGSADDAATNETSLKDGARAWQAYSAADRDAVLDTVVDAFAPFNLCITNTRPASGSYAMLVVTDDDHPSGALAISDIDCGNASSHDEIGFVFGVLALYGSEAKGYVIASVIGSLLGLDWLDDAPDDIMKETIEPNDTGLTFTAGCHALSPAAYCPPTTCTGESQSSRDYLEMVIGLAR